MSECKTGQRIKVIFRNNFHNTEATAIAKIIKFDSDYCYIELSPNTRKRVERKLCGMSDCLCRKIDECESIGFSYLSLSFQEI